MNLYYWRFRKYLPERCGKLCMVLARGRGRGPRNALVEFLDDGFRVVSTRFCVRRAKPQRITIVMNAHAEWDRPPALPPGYRWASPEERNTAVRIGVSAEEIARLAWRAADLEARSTHAVDNVDTTPSPDGRC